MVRLRYMERDKKLDVVQRGSGQRTEIAEPDPLKKGVDFLYTVYSKLIESNRKYNAFLIRINLQTAAPLLFVSGFEAN